jgi:hypothetical protein
MYKAPCSCSTATDKPMMVNAKKHCGGNNRISANGGYTLQSCINKCRSTSGCRKIEVGNNSGCCNGRCDLYSSTSCSPYGHHYFVWYHTNNAAFSDKYVLHRGSEGTQLAIFSGSYHLSTCADKCKANSACREFSIK